MSTRTELHRHLDASIRPQTLVDCASQHGIDVPFSTAADVRDRFWITKQMSSLKEVLDCFKVFQHVLRSEDSLERVAREAIEDAHAEGIGLVELRYSPTFTCEYSGLTWQQAHDAFLRGVTSGTAHSGTKAGLICIVSRGFGLDLAEKTIDFAIANKKTIIGVDLAGLEEGFPCRLYKNMFRRAVDAGLPVTIHAGEASGPENVWEAIDLLGARRIGHGIRSIQDKELVKRLARDRILLETCPTSNFVTRSITEWSEHPLPRFLEAGVPVSISTDDPGIFGITLGEEYERCKSFLGMSEADLGRVDSYAREHSFIGMK